MSGHFKYKNKLFTSSNALSLGLSGRVTILENNEYKITYYEIISGTSGTITPPTGASFSNGDFGLSGNAILSKIDGSNKPTFETPLTAGGVAVTVSLNTGTGSYVTSGTYVSASVALLYSITIKAIDYPNLNTFYILDSVENYKSTGTGDVVRATSPTFVTGITTPLINGTAGTLQIGTTDLVNIGNASTTNQRLVRIGQDTAFADFGSVVGETSTFGIYFGKATPALGNYSIRANSSNNTCINAPSSASILLRQNDVNQANFNGNNIALTPILSSFGALGSPFIFTAPLNTNTAASTGTPAVKFNLAGKQWATGGIATQIEFELTSPTYSFVGASTITNAYSLFVNAPTIGTLATITNNYAAGFSGHIALIDTFGIKFGTTTGGKIGLTTGDKIGKWGVTPIIQPTSANQAAVSGTAGALYTSAEQQLINDLKTLVNQLRADLVSAGNIKGSA